MPEASVRSPPSLINFLSYCPLSIAMPPPIPRLAIGPNRIPVLQRTPQKCPLCSTAQPLRVELRRKCWRIPQLQRIQISCRQRSSEATISSVDLEAPISPKAARKHLRAVLQDLQKIAGNYVNISRLQLALRGLDQAAGHETIRIAVLGLRDGGVSLKRAKQLLRAIIADPLKEEEEWERVLLDENASGRSLLLRIGGHEGEQRLQNRLVEELQIPWPKMNENNLEILVLETDPPVHMPLVGETSFANTVLVPTMEIPTSNTGRYTPVTTPVHRALVIGEGVLGAAPLVGLHGDQDIINAAVNLRLAELVEKPELGLLVMDVEKGTAAIQAFRQDVKKATYFEQGWFESGTADVARWIETGTSTTDGQMKKPVRNLIHSLLQNARSTIQTEEQARLQSALLARIEPSDLDSLRKSIVQWGEQAHTELRDQLDIAFKGQRWRNLGWWKLFFRVDDVSSIASDILSQRFLTDAEKEAIFLSGRFQQAGMFRDNPLTFGEHYTRKDVRNSPPSALPSAPPPPTIRGIAGVPNDEAPSKSEGKDWPLDIPATRTILSTGTVPALQALAQKLVLQTLTTSTFASAFAALIYVSTLTTGFYEAGAVASLGIVYSLRRMQGKWETAREFWEGEVREEGRKAVRSTESALGSVLLQEDKPLDGAEELELARNAVEKAEAALKACK